MSRLSKYDITLVPQDGSQPIGLMLERKQGAAQVKAGLLGSAGVAGQTGPASEEEPVRHPRSRISNNWLAGLGFSRRVQGVDNGYAYMLNGDGRSPGVVTPAGYVTEITLPTGAPGTPLGRVVCSEEFRGDLHVGAGPYILRIVGSSGALTVPGFVSTDSSVTIASLAPFNGNLYGGASSPSGIQSLLQYSGGAWTASGTVYRKYLATLWLVTADGFGSYRLVGTDGDSSFRFVAANPMNLSDWGAQYGVGDSTYNINSIAASAHHAYFCKTNGIHDVDGRGYSPNITPHWQKTYDPNNGSVSVLHNADVIASHHLGLDLSAVSSRQRIDVPTYIHPGGSTGLPNETPIGGRVTALCVGGDGWIYAAFTNSAGDSYLCAGRDKREVGVEIPGPYVWHGALAGPFPSQEITHLRVSSLSGQPRLWIFTWDSSRSLPRAYWQSMPKAATPLQDWLLDGPHRFAESVSVYLPAEDGDDELAVKSLSGFEFAGDNLGAAFWELFARPDAPFSVSRPPLDGERELFANVSPFVDATAGAAASGYNLYQLLRGTGSSDQPPILRALKTRYSLQPHTSKVYQMKVIVGRDAELRGGGRDTRDPGRVLAQLDKLQRAGPVPFYDWLGRRWTAQVLAGTGEEWSELQADVGWTVRMTLSVELKAGPIDQLGGGTTFGSGGVAA